MSVGIWISPLSVSTTLFEPLSLSVHLLHIEVAWVMLARTALTGTISSDTMELFNWVDNFLVIEELHYLQISKARFTNTGPSGGKAVLSKKDSKERWTSIKRFHLIEPSSDFQLYVCADLNCPHYQVGKTECRQYISTLQHFIDHNVTATFVVYQKEEQFTTNDFLTVVNDAQHCNDTRALSKHFSHAMVLQLVEQYKESSDKVDAGRGNIFFDKGLCCSKNMGRSSEHYGLAVPWSRSVDTTMNSKDKEYLLQGRMATTWCY